MDKAFWIDILRTILQYRVLIITPICIGLFIILIINLLKTVLKAKDEVLEKYDIKAKETGTLKRRQKKMSQKGIMYRLNNYNLMPSSYLVVRAMIGIIIAMFSFIVVNTASSAKLAIPISIVFFIIGYFASEFYFGMKNKKDNEAMLIDVYNSYVAIKNQLEAGQYIGDVLQYIYQNTSFDRYKQALMELNINMADKTIPSTVAIDIFKNRFDNLNITKLCSVLNSYYVYGVNEKFINSLTKEIESIITANTMREEESISRKTGLVTFTMFGVVIIMVIYCLVSSFDQFDFF